MPSSTSWRPPAMRTRRRSPARPGSTAGPAPSAAPPATRAASPARGSASITHCRARGCLGPAGRDRQAAPRADTRAGMPAASTLHSRKRSFSSTIGTAIAASATASRFSRRRERKAQRREPGTAQPARSARAGSDRRRCRRALFPSCSITACTRPSGPTAASATARGPSKKLTRPCCSSSGIVRTRVNPPASAVATCGSLQRRGARPRRRQARRRPSGRAQHAEQPPARRRTRASRDEPRIAADGEARRLGER